MMIKPKIIQLTALDNGHKFYVNTTHIVVVDHNVNAVGEKLPGSKIIFGERFGRIVKEEQEEVLASIVGL